MITEEENIVSSRASHSFVDKQTVPLLQSFHPRKMPSDYDYDYSSKIRWVDTSGKLREIESYIIYIYIYKYI